MSSLYLDSKYVELCSAYLRNFKKKKDFLWQCSCPICGDSEKNENKARGYFIKKDDGIMYFCHNCTQPRSMYRFLKEQNPVLFKEYVLEGLEKKPEPRKIDLNVNVDKILKQHKKESIGLPKINELHKDSYVRNYIESRLIPEHQQGKLYFAQNFRAWVESINPDKAIGFVEKEHRIVIPFFDESGDMFAAQGRSLSGNLRYLSIKFNENMPLIYGMDNGSLNTNTLLKVVEGPIDSLFIKNCIAVAGSDLKKACKIYPQEKLFIFDNQPDNRDVCRKMESIISDNLGKIVIWPERMKEKDINDIVIAGNDPEQIIRENTFYGLEAMIRFLSWKKC